MPSGKRSNPVHDTPPKGNEKRTKEKEDTLCSVCNTIIIEEADNVPGDDTVYCEGDCKSWMHRKCVSMSKIIYDKLSNCEEPYLCPNCIITKQTEEITKLKDLVKELTTQLTKLKTSEQKAPISEREPCTSDESISVDITSDTTRPPLLPFSADNHTLY